MPYWKFSGYKNNSPSIPLYVYGETFDFSMTFVNDTDDAFTNSYLYVSREFLGIVQAKLSSEGESAYRDVSGNGDANCYLGYLPIGETSIDFRLKNAGSLTGVRNLYIPIWVAHDDGAPIPCQLWAATENSELWLQCLNHIVFWNDSLGPVDTSTPCIVDDVIPSGFTDSIEPGLLEDSDTPPLWR